MGSTVGAGGVSSALQEAAQDMAPHPGPGTLLRQPWQMCPVLPAAVLASSPAWLMVRASFGFSQGTWMMGASSPANISTTLLLNLPLLGGCWD